jgi:hypothetical protein
MDTMKKQIVIAVILFIGLTNTAKSQVFNVESLDGKARQIHVLSDYGKRILTIAFLNDTLHIKDLTNIEATDILNKHFLRIIYSLRGGSGINLRNTVILTVDGETLCQSLHIMSLFDEEFIDFSKPVDSSSPVDVKSVYEAIPNLTGNNSENYKLNIHIHDERKSKHTSQTNYSRDNQITLNFDTSQHVFYNIHQDISQYFTVYAPEILKETKRYIMGTFPVIKLGQNEYYYIKGEWYKKNDNDYLYKCSYR